MSNTAAALLPSPSLRAIDLIASSGRADSYHAIPKKSQREAVLAKVQAMLDIEQLVSCGKKIGASVIATAKRHRGKRGFSKNKLNDDFKLWRDGGQKQNAEGERSGQIYHPRDWRLFLPNYTNGDVKAALTNPAFVKFVQQLHAATCRDDATGNALRERLLDKWFSGDEIPGYGNIRQWSAERGRSVPTDALARSRKENSPEGWSVTNLKRMLPSKARSVYLRKGEHAAHSHWGDQLLRDRSRLMPLQLVTFDDVRFDIRVVQPIPGKAAQVVYPQAIFALDVATGMILAKAVMGSYIRDEDGDGGKKGSKRGFQHADMRWMMTLLLEQYGLPTDWQMGVLLENASASMSTPDQETFENMTGIRFETTGLIRQKLTSSGFSEQGGMPWQKGWIESLFRLVHTRTNHLPGTVGARYDLTNGRRDPEVAHTLKLCKEAHQKGIDLDELKLPILTIEQFHTLLDQYVELINWRTNHDLQGFCTVHEMQLPDGSWLRSDDPRAAALMTVGTQLESRIEAPAERWQRLITGHKFRQPMPRDLHFLSLDKRVVTIAAEKVTVRLAGQDPLIFRDAETAHHLAKWNGQKKALVASMAADKSCIHLFTNDGDLTYICSPRRLDRVDITDEKAVLQRAGEVSASRQLDRAYAADILAEDEIQLQQMREHNDTTLGRNNPAAAIQQAENRIAQDHARRRRVTAEQAEDLLTPAPTVDDIDDFADEESPF